MANKTFISNYSFLALMGKHFGFLLRIAEKAGKFGKIKVSTSSLSKELNVPQQTVSRKLKDMEDAGLISRQAFADGLLIELTDNGRKLLYDNYLKLKNLFANENSSITATVEPGIGEGSYYVSQKGYQDQFRQKLGFLAFPGTLNVFAKKEDISMLLSSKEAIQIDGFSTNSRTFGRIIAYKVTINSQEAAIVRPERARHPTEILEIISLYNLRNKLKLKDNSKVKIK